MLKLQTRHLLNFLSRAKYVVYSPYRSVPGNRLQYERQKIIIVSSSMHTSWPLTQRTLTTELDAYIHHLAEEVDKKMPTVQNAKRQQRIYRIIQALASLDTSDVEFPVTDGDDVFGGGSSDTEDGSFDSSEDFTNESDGLRLAMQSMRVKSGNSAKQFSRHVVWVVKSLIKHPELAADKETTENVVTVASSVMRGSLGFGLKTISRLISQRPDIFTIDQEVLKSRIQNLRNNQITEGFLQRSISLVPEYLNISEAELTRRIVRVTQMLDFKTLELRQLFLYSPQVFLEPFERVEDKFQYIYFSMGYKKHYVLARHGLLRYPLEHLRMRHLFLERRGQYQLPDKQRNTTIILPKLKDVLCTSDVAFCRDVALCDMAEYRLFKEMLHAEDAAREEPEERTPEYSFADKLLDEMK